MTLLLAVVLSALQGEAEQDYLVLYVVDLDRPAVWSTTLMGYLRQVTAHLRNFCWHEGLRQGCEEGQEGCCDMFHLRLVIGHLSQQFTTITFHGPQTLLVAIFLTGRLHNKGDE